MVKELLGMLTAHIRMPGFQSQLHMGFRFPAHGHPRRQQMMAPVLGSLQPLWSTQSVLHPCPWPDSALTAACILGVNQQIEDLYF